MKALIVAALVAASPAFGQGYETLPNGETMFSPQPNDYPVRQYYHPQGGPPAGYTVQTPDVDIYVPYRGGPSYALPRER